LSRLCRGVVLLIYSPVGKRDADQIMSDCIRPWLRMVYSLTPGAPIMLICSHLESPPEGPDSSGTDCAQWRDDVLALAGEVFQKVCSECIGVMMGEL
jgi:hypothetical protein